MTALRRVEPLYVLAAVLFVVAVAVASAGTPGDRIGIARSASVHDNGPGGTAVLHRWLEALGVRTRILEGERFTLEPDDSVMLVLGATEPVSRADAARLDAFVAGGGTLVVATEAALSESSLLATYGVTLAGPSRSPVTAVTAATAASGARSLSLDIGRVLELGTRLTPIAHASNGAVAATARQGAGTVFVVGSLAPFLSGQIDEADNGRFVLALVSDAIRTGRTVVFDEYHHGVHPPPNILAILERTWPGRALVAMGLLVLAFIVLTGRRLGPPLPLEHRPARSSLEHVRAFAGLVRRSGRGEIARERLRRDLRGGLARMAGMDPAAPLERILDALAGVSPARAAEARAIDAELARPLRDADLLRSVRRIDAVLGERE